VLAKRIQAVITDELQEWIEDDEARDAEQRSLRGFDADAIAREF
jgi:hypothetical protein